MNSLAKTLLMVALVTLGCRDAWCESTNKSLNFFIVSEYEVKGGRFIDTTKFPKLGFVAEKPDLAVTKLVDVSPAKIPRRDVVDDGKGKQKLAPRPTLKIKLTEEDAKGFKKLTKTALGQKLLMVFNGELLRAPTVQAPISTGEFTFDFASEEELQRMEKLLKELVR